MRLKFSANLSLLFTELELIDRFKVAKQCGFEAVEIQFPYSLPSEQIKQALLENKLKLVLFNIDADDLLQGGEGLAAVPEKQEHFLKALQQSKKYAEILQPELINVLPGCCNNQDRISEYLTTFSKNLLIAVETFASLGIKTVFEAINTLDMPGYIINNGEGMLKIIQQINHPMLLMQLDIYHMTRMEQDLGQFISKNADKIGHIQFADVPGRGQPGSGNINFAQLFSDIEQSRYTGSVGAEYIPVGLTEKSLDWLPKNQSRVA